MSASNCDPMIPPFTLPWLAIPLPLFQPFITDLCRSLLAGAIRDACQYTRQFSSPQFRSAYQLMTLAHAAEQKWKYQVSRRARIEDSCADAQGTELCWQLQYLCHRATHDHSARVGWNLAGVENRLVLAHNRLDLIQRHVRTKHDFAVSAGILVRGVGFPIASGPPEDLPEIRQAFP